MSHDPLCGIVPVKVGNTFVGGCTCEQIRMVRSDERAAEARRAAARVAAIGCRGHDQEDDLCLVLLDRAVEAALSGPVTAVVTGSVTYGTAGGNGAGTIRRVTAYVRGDE